MHRKILVLILVLVSLVLSGCKADTELVEPTKMSNKIIEMMNSNTEQGIYMVSSSKEQVIIYRGVEKGIKEMSYSVHNNVLEILFETAELNQPEAYVYKVNLNPSYDTIQIIIDGKKEAFRRVLMQQYYYSVWNYNEVFLQC